MYLRNVATPHPAPDIHASYWLNTQRPQSLAEMRGFVVVLHAFQMLCPGCVTHGLPQVNAIHSMYKNDPVKVIGIHTVFEHHNVMGIEALEVFAHEYRLTFPIAVDQQAHNDPIPLTMQAYDMQGTPTLILIDKAGNLRLNHFGQLSDMQVGNMLGQLLTE